MTMRKRPPPPTPTPATPASDGEPTESKRPKPARRPDPARQDPIPKWLHDAAAAFVDNTPALNWTGGFYSWGTWLHHLRHSHLWTRRSASASADDHPPPWRALINACRQSGQVCGTAALYRAKSDLVTVIINFVYRRGEAQRLRHASQEPAAERDIMRRVRAVVTRQRRHEALSFTLVRFLDLAFVFSAYKDCRKALAPEVDPERLDREIEEQLLLFDAEPTVQHIRSVTGSMQAFMLKNRFLPWYERIPSVRDEMVLRAREAAMTYCRGLPFPELHVRAGVRGLSRDHIAGAGSMNEWLMGLIHPRLVRKWHVLADVYDVAVEQGMGEEEALLEETARRVVELVLEPLTEMKEGSDAAQSKLVDAAPGIVVTQAVRIAGRFTFRQVLELYIHLAMFGRYLHRTFYGCSLPSIEQIHAGILLFEEIRTRVLEVRPLIDSDKVERLYDWCLATTDAHTREGHASLAAYGGCIAYQHAAIRAAMGPSVMLTSHCKKPMEETVTLESDPLHFAAIIAEWDPPLAAKIVDASVRIGRAVRTKFQNGRGGGLDLYTHRRVLVCDAARERFQGDVKAAARIMSKLHAVWNVCESDKGVGSFDGRGAMALKMAVDKGNFEAASVFGLLLCSEEWEERRRSCNLERDMAAGVSHICKAISMGDTAAAADLLHLIQVHAVGEIANGQTEVSSALLEEGVKCLKDAAKEEASLSLFLGYLYSLGAPGVKADCKQAISEYERVLSSVSTSTAYRAYAANNLGTLRALNVGGDEKNSSHDDKETRYYFKASASAGNVKAASNLAAVLCQERYDAGRDINLATELYGRVFHSPEGDVPITVVQTDGRSAEMSIIELAVRRDRQDLFCQELRSEGMQLQRYGDVLLCERIPFVYVTRKEGDGTDRQS